MNTQNNKENYQKCSPIKRLEFVKRPAEQSNQKRLIRKKRKTKLPSAFSHLPPPDDGQHFKPKEIIDIWNTVIKKYIAQTRFTQHLISNNLVPVKKNAASKTTTRFTAENSLTSAMTLCCLVAYANYDITMEENQKLVDDIWCNKIRFPP